MDRRQVTHAARNGIPFTVVTHRLPPETEQDLEQILILFLEELGQSSMRDHLSYILRELTGNAKKANTKRVYFEEKGLRLDDPGEYDLGMKTFKNDTLNNIDHYLDLQEKRDLTIKVTFLLRDHTLFLTVRNSAAIAAKELTRAYDRIARSRAFESMAEAFEEVLDETEGAGLGIVIMILMLRSMGLSEKSFSLALVGGETSASMTIPGNAQKVDAVGLITDEVVATIEALPPFPENLQQLIRLLDDPGVAMEALAAQLGRDPAMSADLIRYLNSARVGRRSGIADLHEAVQLVGIQGLKDLAYSFGAHRLLEKYLPRQKRLWDNALRASWYASELARKIGGDRATASRAQLAGLLSNLGQIILSFLHPEESERILGFCRARGFSVAFFNELTQAVNPGEVAGRIAEKWHFPDDLVQVLRYQAQPSRTPVEVQPLACAVHLAASLVAVEEGLMTYPQVNAGVLKALKLQETEALAVFHQGLRDRFDRPS